jgi:signal peptidase II
MKSYRLLWISAFVFLLDQGTKWIVKTNMRLYESHPVLGDFFRLTYVENPGMAFGIRISDNVFFTVFAVIASLVILLYLFQLKERQEWARISMTIILGGALGNLVDRIFRGQVVDFFDFEFFNIHIPAFKLFFLQFSGYSLERWPIFNVADIAVSVGMVMLLIYILFFEEEQPLPKTEYSDTTEMIR